MTLCRITDTIPIPAPELLDQIENRRRKIDGTWHRVVTQLHRTGPSEWTVTRGVCNGIAGSVETYDVEADARAAFARRPRGRPALRGEAGQTFTLRATPGELAAWHAAAGREGVATRDFVVAATNAAARSRPK